MNLRPLAPVLLPLSFLLAAASAASDAVTADEAEIVSRNWLVASASPDGPWRGDVAPTIAGIEPVRDDGVLLGWHVAVRPSGYVVVPAVRELPPVYASGETATWADGEENPFLPVVREALSLRRAQLDADAAAARDHERHPAWSRYAVAPPLFVRGDKSGDAVVGPLLSTSWHQAHPFNLLCPPGDSLRTFVGCTALAAAQLMNHHRWPPRGLVVTGYDWDGDDCAETPVGARLEADLRDAYDWDAVPDVVDVATPAAGVDAVARLCYDVAVACRMDFGTCGSAASPSMARAALMDLFRYRTGIREVVRFRFTADDWFAEIRDDVDQGLPVLYSTVIHTMVCDGWREVDGLRQIHLNFGWGGASDNWYTLDDIETSLNPAAERMILDIEPDRSVGVESAAFSFAAVATAEGVRVTWAVPAEQASTAFVVLRSSAGTLPQPLHATPLTGHPSYDYLDDDAPAGLLEYRLEAASPAGEVQVLGPVRVAVTDASGDPAPSLHLRSPAPNPANPRAAICFDLAKAGAATLVIHDSRGRRVRTLVDSFLAAGSHERTWNGATETGRAAPSGVYFVRLEVDGEREIRKLLLAR